MKNNVLNLLTHRCTYFEGVIYCVSRDFNLLFSINVQTGTIELIDIIPDEDILTTFICGYITVRQNKLILAPFTTKKIWIYDLGSKYWDSVTTKELDHCVAAGGFQQAYEYKNKLFLIGSGYPAILSLDLENNSCDYIEAPYKDMIARHPKPDNRYFGYYGVKSANILYLVSLLDNYILKFDMDTLEYHWIKIGNDNHTYVGITWGEKNFWISPRSGSDIIKWNGKDDVKPLPLPDQLKQHNEYVWGICYDEKKMVLPAFGHDNTILINTEDDTMQIYKQQYTMYSHLDNGMVISQTLEGELTLKTDQTVKKFNPSIDINQLKQFYEGKNLSIFNGGTLYHEAQTPSPLSLENYLAFLTPASQNKPSADEQVGKVIWEAIR